MTNRSVRWLLAIVAPLTLLAAACGDDDDDDTSAGDGGGGGTCSEASAPDDAPAVTIGAQDFGESAIVASIYQQCLEAAGYDASIAELGGFRDVELEAFDAGDINLAPEYAASMLEFLNDNAGEATPDAAETTDALNERLTEIDLVAAEPSDARNTNAFAVTQETADELGLETISDLADHPNLVLGAPADCETNAGCLPGLQETYGIDLSANFTALEPAAIPAALDAGEIDIAVVFSTDAVVVQEDLVILEDDQGLFKADNIVPVMTTELSEVDGFTDLLNAISAEMTTDGVADLNVAFQVEREDAEAVASTFLTDAGLT